LPSLGSKGIAEKYYLRPAPSSAVRTRSEDLTESTPKLSPRLTGDCEGGEPASKLVLVEALAKSAIGATETVYACVELDQLPTPCPLVQGIDVLGNDRTQPALPLPPRQG